MARIPEKIVDEIYRAADIVEIVSDYVALKKRGQNHWALSPFTQEKTPSFAVNPSKNIYKCFSTGKGGNAVSFLMEMEGYSYLEALKYIARKYHIEIEAEEETPEEKERKDKRQSLFIVNEFAARFYHSQLLDTEQGRKIGLSYFKERGLLESTVQEFQLGFAPDSWDSLYKAATQQQYNLEYFEELGLLSRSEKTGNLYDRFRDRVIFPITNAIGKVVGFGGRILTSQKDTGKYINSSESLIYNKSQLLYGLSQARQHIRSQDLCILTEGYMDTLMLHQNGIRHVVASSGTALTIEQIRLIRRYTRNVLMIYDGDQAGIKAALRGIDLLVKENMNIKVLILPDNHDPDSYVNTFGAQVFTDYAEARSMNFIDFKLDILRGDERDPVAQADLVKELARTIGYIEDLVQRQMYIKQVAQEVDITEGLMSHAVSIAQRETAKIEAREAKRERTLSEKSADVAVKTLRTFENLELAWQEKELLRIILNYFDQTFVEDSSGPLEDEDGNPIEQEEIPLMEFFTVELESLQFENQIYEKLKNELFDCYQQDNMLNIHHYLDHQDAAIRSLVSDLLTMPHEISPNWRKHGAFILDHDADLTLTVKSAMYIYKNRKLNKLIKQAQQKLEELSKTDSSEEEEDKLIKIFSHLKNMQQNLSKKIGMEGAILANDGTL